MTRRRGLRVLVAVLAMSLVAAACSDDNDDEPAAQSSTDDGGASSGDTAEGDELTPVSLQLQWFAQAQFAGYYAALAEGYYEDEGLDVEIVEGGVDIVPQTQVATGAADFAIAWVPKALASREQGEAITNIGQIFQRSGTLQVSWADDGISGVEDLAGKNVGNWGFGNEFELFAGLQQAGIDPQSGVTLVQQQFDMAALLAREIDAAQAMTYNEYAQLLETMNPDTGELYTPDEFSVINWNDVGTAMLQDAIWAETDRLSDDAFRDTAVRFLRASMRGWIFCRDEPDACVQHVLEAGPTLGTSHQTWQLAEVNKLIWPSPGGIGVMDQDLWDQTVAIAVEQGIIQAEPDADAFTADLATEAVEGVDGDTTGDGYEAPDVTLEEGGA
jgi:NitT/TauT family transport system substrate-binding protein